MKRSDLARLLTMVKSIDDRISVDEARVYAWELVLDSDLTFDFGVEALKRHYSVSNERIMPSHLNVPWRAYKRDESLQQASLERRTQQGVPATAEFKEALNKIRRIK